MEVRKRVLWKVPVFCLIVGELVFQISVRRLPQWAIFRSLTVDTGKEMLISGGIFVLTLLIGRWYFRTMTRKEIFLSASILVVLGVIWYGIFIASFAHPLTGGAALVYSYFSRVYEWSTVISQLVYRISGTFVWSIFLQFLSPYLFVLFGGKEEPTVAQDSNSIPSSIPDEKKD